MSVLSFFQKLRQGWLGNASRRRSQRSVLPRSAQLRPVRLRIEELEERTLLATLPPAIVSNTQALAGGSSPAVAIDPIDSQKVVAAYSTVDANGFPALGLQFSSDGGNLWSTATFTNTFDPSTNTVFGVAGAPSISFDRSENFYVAYTETNTTAVNAGIVALRKFSFTGNAPTSVILGGGSTLKRLYEWVGQDAAFNPAVAVDSNMASFTDPDTGDVQTDTMSGKSVYVAWHTLNTAPGPLPANAGLDNNGRQFGTFVPNDIQIVASADGGFSFTGQVFLSDGFHYNGNPLIGTDLPAFFPQLAFTQGSATVVGNTPRVTGGELVAVWSTRAGARFDVTQPDVDINGVTQPASSSVVLLTTAGRAIADAFDPGGGANHVPGVTTSTRLITAADISDPNFDTVVDLNVLLSLVHPHLNQVRITLNANKPGANGFNITATLLNNRTDQANNNFPPTGLPDVANMGVLANNNIVRTVFDQQASRAINDPTSAAPFTAHFRPEQGNINSGGLNQFNGLTAADLVGSTWTLTITDFRSDGNNPPPTQFLNAWQLHFSARIDTGAFGTDGVVGGAANAIGTVGASAQPNFPSASPAAPRGLPPALSLAIDNTLGSFSPFQGRVYIAYTDGGNGADVRLVSTDRISSGAAASWNLVNGAGVRVNDDSLFDFYSEGIRAQFLPGVTVDQATGTVGISFFDARKDASLGRVVTTFTTSIDGGRTFASQVFLNQEKTAFDLLTRQDIVLEPLPSNPVGASPTVNLGDRMGLAMFGGQVYPFWTGNVNSASASIFTATTTVAGGPRIIQSDMGPVVASASNLAGAYNNTFAADGTRQLDGFTVTFDRPVDPTTFTLGDVEVRYRDTVTPASTSGTLVDVASVTSLDDGTLYGPARVGGVGRLATIFFVRFTTPQTAAGTYSYAIAPLINDRIRTTADNRLVVPVSPNPVNLRIPPSGTGGSGNPALDVSTSTIDVQGVAAGVTIVDLDVSLRLTHTFDGDLAINLIAPNNTVIPLSIHNGGAGDNYTNTTFDDEAGLSIDNFNNPPLPAPQANPPFTGRFRPEALLSAIDGLSPNGIWKLQISDDAGLDFGNLETWALRFQLSVVPGPKLGNQMDQNNNAITNEAATSTTGGDVYAIPLPANRQRAFQLPYDTETLPLIIPGPHVVSTSVAMSSMPVQPVTADNLVLNGTVQGIDVTFDRDIRVDTFTPEDILRVMGPIGQVTGAFTITPDSPHAGINSPSVARTFRVGFPASQTIGGTYTITLGPDIQADTGLNRGDRMDANFNAGLALLRGFDPSSGVFLDKTYASGNVAQTVSPARETTSVITITDAYSIVDANVSLDITIPNPDAPNLRAVLISPKGTSVTLFDRVGSRGTPPLADFRDTILDDEATTPIQAARPPFAGGPFNPQTPLSALDGESVAGDWQLIITDFGSNSGTLNHWSLTFRQQVPGSGLGEAVADQTPVSFRIFTMDATNVQSHNTWTAVGPSADNSSQNAGRVTALAMDPTDPTGNTVYIGAASGGVWKSSNFLTTDAIGPRWIPLTDFGPTFAMNIGSIAVYPQNNDPRRTIIFAATGEGDSLSSGVGFLRSMDGGATWDLLDSLNNDDGTGQISPINAATRNRQFVGSSSFKIIIDPTRTLSGELVLYAALSGTNAGIYRSMDTGRHWQLMLAGAATDVALAAGSAAGAGQLQIVYAALRGTGLQYSLNQGENWVAMPGGSANQLLRDIVSDQPVPVTAIGDPNGNKGRISLAVPAKTGDVLKDFYLTSWLYALVSTAGGRLDGVYMTKDFGQTWTKLRLPQVTIPPPVNIITGRPTNNEAATNTDHDTIGTNAFRQGNDNQAIAVDPVNPNIIYIGGTDRGQLTPGGGFGGGVIRVDTTGMSDSQALVVFDNSDSDGNQVQGNTTGPASRDPRLGGWFLRTTSGSLAFPVTYSNRSFLNLVRDPDNPFLTDSTLRTFNITVLNNEGTDLRWRPFTDLIDVSIGNANHTSDVHEIYTFTDPTTGQTRVVLGNDHGVYTGVSTGPTPAETDRQRRLDLTDGSLHGDIGFARVVNGSRNGNLQIAQFMQGAVQPGPLAAQVAGALFYGMSEDNGYPVSNSDILSTGNLNWHGPLGDGTGIVTNQQGTGEVYQDRWASAIRTPYNDAFTGTDFIRLIPVGTYTSDYSGLGRTGTTGASLIQPGDNPNTNAGQWPFQSGENLAINPINGQALLISAPRTGRVFMTEDGGIRWFPIGEPGQNGFTSNSYAPALAFGAPDPARGGRLDDFIYVGTTAGNIYVTFNAGTWTNISNGLAGNSVRAIVTNPLRGSHEAFAVTDTGVFWMPDSSVPLPVWLPITSNLLTLTHDSFGKVSLQETQLKAGSIETLVADWRFRIPIDPNNPTGPTTPVLYVGGEGGVYRSMNRGTTWTHFPDVANDGAPAEGGYLPNVRVTRLDLATGNIIPLTGLPDPTTTANVLVATTYGRGSFAIRLSDAEFVSGPRVIAVTPNTTVPPAPGLTDITLLFGGAIDPTTFTAVDLNITDPNGTVLTSPADWVLSDITSPPAGSANLHNLWQIHFNTPQTTIGTYRVTAGPNIQDPAGRPMNQDGDTNNGEAGEDAFVGDFVVGTPSPPPPPPPAGGGTTAADTGSTGTGAPLSFLIARKRRRGNLLIIDFQVFNISLADIRGRLGVVALGRRDRLLAPTGLSIRLLPGRLYQLFGLAGGLLRSQEGQTIRVYVKTKSNNPNLLIFPVTDDILII